MLTLQSRLAAIFRVGAAEAAEREERDLLLRSHLDQADAALHLSEVAGAGM